MKYCSAVDLTRELHPSKEVRYEARKAEKNKLVVSEVSFTEFRSFYSEIVSVKKTREMWDSLSAQHSTAFLAKKDGVPISGAAFVSHGGEVYYSMAVTNFSSPYSDGAGYLLQLEVMKALKEKGYTLYVIGLLDDGRGSPKLKNISVFKEKLGNRYIVEGDTFPFKSYTPVV